MQFPLFFTIILGKVTSYVSGILRLGSGSTWPGHIGLSVRPSLFEDFVSSFSKGVVFITGTNGKTTVSHMIVSILRLSGFRVVHNEAGANLLNGIASSLIKSSPIFRKSFFDIGVFEVDEGALPSLLSKFPPNYLIMLNLTRDQLDRFGEIDITAQKWEESLSQLERPPVVIVNSLDSRLVQLGKVLSQNGLSVHTFGEDSSLSLGGFRALNEDAVRRVCILLKVAPKYIETGLSQFRFVFGRGEEIPFHNRTIKIFLSKNPSSFNENLKLLRDKGSFPHILFILNDNIPDGRDVSWIYDISSDYLRKVCTGRSVYVSGLRAWDMALRLKYAKVPLSSVKEIQVDINKIIEIIVKNTSSGDCIAVLPTYSAMLMVRKIVAGSCIK